MECFFCFFFYNILMSGLYDSPLLHWLSLQQVENFSLSLSLAFQLPPAFFYCQYARVNWVRSFSSLCSSGSWSNICVWFYIFMSLPQVSTYTPWWWNLSVPCVRILVKTLKRKIINRMCKLLLAPADPHKLAKGIIQALEFLGSKFSNLFRPQICDDHFLEYRQCEHDQ